MQPVPGSWPLTFAVALVTCTACAEDRICQELRRFDAPEAVQAVAVDEGHFYAISNRTLAKYDKHTGRRVSAWTTTESRPLVHLNSGLVRDGKLYCAHSNFPAVPEASSVEIWDVATLEHVGSHSLGIYEGSLTWIDWHDDSWWAVFAHYSKQADRNPFAKPTRWTSLVRFDSQWRRTGGWTFPEQVLERFEPDSSSGGGWGPGGLLYCTGHDRGELYCLRLPEAGSELVLIETIPIDVTGQGIAWDRDDEGIIYGIDRKRRQVVVSRLTSEPLQRDVQQEADR